MSEQPRSFGAPRGTYDVLPPESWGREAVVALARRCFAGAGYAPVETPVFEHTEVFERGVGEASEVVDKQMYTFRDRAGRSLTLRPEGTAPVVRAVLEHGVHRGPLPVKLYYAGPMFRQERPQRGRFRQFVQVGIEAVGADTPLIDAEVIEVGSRYLAEAGVETRLLLNSIGHLDPACRGGYLELLRDFLEGNAGRLAAADRDRLATNPLRTFDSKEPQTVEVMAEAPVITEHLCDDCREHFDEVRGLLEELGVGFELAPRLVRGLDYYTRTAFEYVAGGLGSQDAVGGGGRYDGLSEALGGPPLPGIGFALGVDRIAISRGASEEGAIDFYFVALGNDAARAALRLATELRRGGARADLDLAGRGLKGQMKAASRSGARLCVILGDEELAAGEATIKDLRTGEQERVPFEDLARSVAAT